MFRAANADRNYVIVCNIGSDAILVQLGLICSDEPSQIDFPPTIHLTFDELEACDLAFGLSVRPGRSDRRLDRRFIIRHAAGERCDKTGTCALNPGQQFGAGATPDHQVEFSNDLACFDQGWYARLQSLRP